MFFKKKKELHFSLPFLGFLQASGLTVYCGLIGALLWHGNDLFGPPHGFWGPTLVLVLLVISALVCALIAFGHAFRLFWVWKKPDQALRLVAYTTAWLMLFFFISLFLLAVLL